MIEEMGGYFEFEHYKKNAYHKNSIALNTGRNCLRYLIRAKKIQKIFLPDFVCEVVVEACRMENIEIHFYQVNRLFRPQNIEKIGNDDYIYVINYYGQLSNENILQMAKIFPNIIIDNAQAFFQKPVSGVDTIYNCRKFFGVTDGAYLYTDHEMDVRLEKDMSYQRMEYLLGRYECGANKFFEAYQDNEKRLSGQQIKRMSSLTENILKSIDYAVVSKIREDNYDVLEDNLGSFNMLQLRKASGPYMYPFMVKNGNALRKKLIARKIYIPVLWPNIVENCENQSDAYFMANNILPLPCDQRYTKENMIEMIEIIKGEMEEIE